MAPPAVALDHIPAGEAGVLAGHEGPVLAVRFNAQGTYCLTCGKVSCGKVGERDVDADPASPSAPQDRTLQLWNPHRELRIKTYTGHGYEVRDAAVAVDNARFASCGGDRQVFLWDVTAGTVVRKFRGHDGAVNAVRYSGNGEVLVTGGYDAAVKVWDCRSRSPDPVQAMRHFRDSVTSVAVTPRGDIFAGSVDGTVRRFDVRAGRAVTDLVHHPVTCVAVSAAGDVVLAACTDACVRLLDVADGDLLGAFRGHVHAETRLDAVFWGAGESYVAAGSEDGRVVFWEVAAAAAAEGGAPQPVAALEGGSAVTALAAHPGGECLLTACMDGTVRVWR